MTRIAVVDHGAGNLVSIAQGLAAAGAERVGERLNFRDPWGNRIQVGDLHDESLVWLLPYREVQTTGISFGS